MTATTPGALFYFNPIRKGSEASDEAVYDRASGKPLRFEVVDGAAARAAGETKADLDTRYIKVELPRPVPKDGELRLRIDKTYKDPKSYFSDGERVVFSRSLSVSAMPWCCRPATSSWRATCPRRCSRSRTGGSR